MGKIVRLSDHLIDKIAAGEVIVRPASVVKELIENSIDAGSTRIRISVTNSTRDISIIDDGCGIDSDEMLLAFERHSTSKIKSIDDLETLSTRGFRGEALASISAVARVEMISRPERSLSGYRVQIEGGKHILGENTGAPSGTSIHVRSLFYNVPARLKFLKSEISEMNMITQTITAQALSSPNIGFKLQSDSDIIFDLPANQTLKERIISVFGNNLSESLLIVSKETPLVNIYGFIAKPEQSKKDRQSEHFFVQKRPIVCKTLNYCLEQAYQGLLMTRRFPVCVIFLDMPEGEVDVNVHPTKLEVRFRDERIVSSSLFHAVKEALSKAILIPQMSIGGGETKQDVFDEIINSKPDSQNNTSRPEQTQRSFSNDLFKNPDVLVRRDFDENKYKTVEDDFFGINKAMTPAPSPDLSPKTKISLEHFHREMNETPLPTNFDAPLVSAPDSPETILQQLWNSGTVPEPIGQIAETYIVSSFENNLLFIDQHAAHERIMYNRLKDLESKRLYSKQTLLIPIIIEVKISDIPIINSIIPALSELGFELIPFGGASFSIQSVPLDLQDIDFQALISDIIDDMRNQKEKSEIDSVRDRIITRAACHSAVRGKQTLSVEEMRKIILDLKNIYLPFTCPHGRPTMILLTKNQLDKLFKRIVS